MGRSFRFLVLIGSVIIFGVWGGLSCRQKKMVESEPSDDELKGVYVGVNPENGNVTQLKIDFPQLVGINVPLNSFDSASGTRKLISSDFTSSYYLSNQSPGGEWCIVSNQQYFRIYMRGGEFELWLIYDVVNNRSIIYKKKKMNGRANQSH